MVDCSFPINKMEGFSLLFFKVLFITVEELVKAFTKSFHREENHFITLLNWDSLSVTLGPLLLLGCSFNCAPIPGGGVLDYDAERSSTQSPAEFRAPNSAGECLWCPVFHLARSLQQSAGNFRSIFSSLNHACEHQSLSLILILFCLDQYSALFLRKSAYSAEVWGEGNGKT